MSNRFKYTIVGASTCLMVLLLVGSVLGQSSNPDDTFKHIGVFSEVVSYIKDQYVEEPDMKSVTLGALNGLLEAVDPFASYLNADQYRDYVKNKDLKRADVGLILAKKFGYLGVVDAVPGSPADKAGFTTHDMIESVKGISTRDMPLAYAAILLQGESNTTVELSVVRVRHPEPQTVTLMRANLAMPPVESRMLAGQVGYIEVGALSDAQLKDIAEAIGKLQRDGAAKLVVDVRHCAVGTPEDGIALANLFLSKGLITYVMGQRYPRQDIQADPAKAITTLPVAFLTNQGTAGGAEIAAAAIQDSKRGSLVGDRTYGDAAIRKPITTEDGGAIILSVAKYYSPGGKAIQDTTVVPQYVVAEQEPSVDYDDNGEPIPAPAVPQAQPKKLEDDPVLKKALEVLGK
ncbi:MAG TPA: S41 family peptidase [Bryobacteraceae bacterium]|nr:S41 family peptidase [Bryobacteraceae bacterium]